VITTSYLTKHIEEGHESILDQYQWIYTREDINNAFIVLDTKLQEFSDIITYLGKITKDEIKFKQKHISKILLKSQYSIPSDDISRNLPSPSVIMNQWNTKSDEKDAVDYMIEGF